MPRRESWVVAGASRGLGREFVAQLGGAADVTALSRSDGFDVKDEGAFRVDGPVDVLVVCAGVQNRAGSLADLDFDSIRETFDVNAIGPLRVIRALRPNLEAGNRRLIAVLSSRMGSFGEYDGPSMWAYRASKAALNTFVRCAADELGGGGFTVVALHPGWVRTDMGGPDAALSTEESVRGMLDVLSRAENGQFLDHRGHVLPW